MGVTVDKINIGSTADTDLLKMVPVEILLNFENYFCTLQLGLSGIMFLYY